MFEKIRTMNNLAALKTAFAKMACKAVVAVASLLGEFKLAHLNVMCY